MTQPTEERLSDPKWWDENAPEWASSIGLAGIPRNPVWFNLKQYQYLSGDRRVIDLGELHTYGLGDIELLGSRPAKPQASEWDGEGLPPAGIQCECYYTGLSGKKQWIECDVVGPYGDYVICAPNGGGFYGFDADELRPIRTKEKRDLEEFARSLLDDLDALGLNVSGDTAMAVAIGFMNRGWHRGD